MTSLQKIERAAAKAAVARSVLEQRIHEAHSNGYPLREIAKAAGVSHEQVRRILAR